MVGLAGTDRPLSICSAGRDVTYAEDFMDGHRIADRAGMAREYVESFLEDFHENGGDAMVAKRRAMREWDLG